MVTGAHRHLDIRIYFKEARTLAAAGYDVVVVAPWPGLPDPDDAELITIEAPRGRLHRFTVGSWRAYRAAAAARGNVYHLHDPELLLWAPWLRRSGATVVFDMHEHTPKALLRRPWIPAFRGVASRVYRWLERRLIGPSPVVFAESSYVADYPWVSCGVEVLNMPLLDELAAVPRGPKHVEPTVGYLGQVTAARGSVTVLQALAELNRRGRRVEWECVGSVPDGHRAELEELIERLGLASQVRLRGFLPPQDGWAAMARCHAGLAVLDANPNSVDSYPTKLFEYMALGVPAIVSDFPLWRAVVQPAGCGLTVPPSTPAALADSIEALVADPGAAAAMGERGEAAVVAHYSWEREAAKLVEFYAAVAPHSPQ